MAGSLRLQMVMVALYALCDAASAQGTAGKLLMLRGSWSGEGGVASNALQ